MSHLRFSKNEGRILTRDSWMKKITHRIDDMSAWYVNLDLRGTLVSWRTKRQPGSFLLPWPRRPRSRGRSSASRRLFSRATSAWTGPRPQALARIGTQALLTIQACLSQALRWPWWLRWPRAWTSLSWEKLQTAALLTSISKAPLSRPTWAQSRGMMMTLSLYWSALWTAPSPF